MSRAARASCCIVSATPENPLRHSVTPCLFPNFWFSVRLSLKNSFAFRLSPLASATCLLVDFVRR